MGNWVLKLNGLPKIMDQFDEGTIDIDFVFLKTARLVYDFWERYYKKPKYADIDWDKLDDIFENFRMGEGGDEEDFDSVLQDLYDWADDNSVWIEPV